MSFLYCDVGKNPTAEFQKENQSISTGNISRAIETKERISDETLILVRKEVKW